MTAIAAAGRRYLPRGWADLARQLAIWFGFLLAYQLARGFAISAAILTAFAVIEKRVAHPLIRFSILKEGWVARANLSAVGLFGSYLSFQFIVKVATDQSVSMMPSSAAIPSFGQFDGPRAHKFQPGGVRKR